MTDLGCVTELGATELAASTTSNTPRPASRAAHRPVSVASEPLAVRRLLRTLDPLRVLVVDEPSPMRSAYVRALWNADHIVRTADDGVEALALCDVETFDLVVANLHSPRMGGIELAEHLGPQTAVLFVTRFPTRLTELAANRSALHGPFTPSVFLKRVREMSSAHRHALARAGGAR